SDQTGLVVTNNLITANARFSSGGLYINPGINTGGSSNPILVANNTITGPILSLGVAVDTMSFVMVSRNNISRTSSSSALWMGGMQLIFAAPYNGSSDQQGILITGNTVSSNHLPFSVGIEAGNTNNLAPFNNNRLLDVELTDNVVRDNQSGIVI